VEDNLEVDLIIGNSASSDQVFDGVIDEIRLWNGIRNSIQIQSNMFFYLQGNETDLQAYWKLNEGNGNIVHDATSNTENGIINNCCWVEGYFLIPVSTENEVLPVNEHPYLNSYPNPFNPATTIIFSAPRSQAELSIYNLKGQMIDHYSFSEIELVSDNKVSWDASLLPSGIYIVRLKTGSSSISHKMLLIK
jgi:hypothetical protein